MEFLGRSNKSVYASSAGSICDADLKPTHFQKSNLFCCDAAAGFSSRDGSRLNRKPNWFVGNGFGERRPGDRQLSRVCVSRARTGRAESIEHFGLRVGSRSNESWTLFN